MPLRTTQRFFSIFVPLAVLFASSQSGCSCTDSATGSGGFGASHPCSFSPSCGKDCSTDAQCSSGLHCSAAGTCAADCHAPEDQCAHGTCDANGRCPGGGDGGSGGVSTFVGSGTSTHAGGTGGCGEVNIQFEPVTPTVTLLIDQSGSMTEKFPPGSNVTRWEAVYNAVMDPALGPVKALEGQVRFGLVLYTGDTSCPQLLQVMPPKKNNYDAMNALWGDMTNTIPINNTPTAESISAIVPEIVAVNKPGPKLILLATDGDPDDCANPNSNGTQLPRDEAVMAVQAAFTAGIQTVILAVGDEVDSQHQQDMGNAGMGYPVTLPGPGTPCNEMTDPMCATTYKPTDQAAMIAAFNSIINGTRTCVFTLDGSVVAGKECQGTVKINGMDVPCNDPDGWKLDDPMTIEFTGQACQDILNDPTVDITAHFPCDAASTGSGPK